MVAQVFAAGGAGRGSVWPACFRQVDLAAALTNGGTRAEVHVASELCQEQERWSEMHPNKPCSKFLDFVRL